MAGSLAVDLLVIGGGMAGSSAAGYAAANGARVALLEKGPVVGGSAALLGKTLNFWAAPTLEALRQIAPEADLELTSHVVEGYPEAAAWIRSLGPYLGAPVQLGMGRGYTFEVAAYIARCAELVEDAGGRVLTEARATTLLRDGGRISGAAVEVGGETIEIRSRATLLATGGFQGNRELLRRHLGPNGDRVVIRSNPHSTGDGMALALGAGAALDGDMKAFYGHLMAGGMSAVAPEDFSRLMIWYSVSGILLNEGGRRFTDESRGDNWNAQALALQPGARGIVVLDDLLVRNLARRGVTIGACFDAAREAGGRVDSCETLEELAATVEGWGFDGAQAVASIEAYNDHLYCRSELPDSPRTGQRFPLVDAPFAVQEVQVGITFTEGGIKVDTAARALDEEGRPVEGLYVAGADMGGVYEGSYAGGLALGAVFGMTAVRHGLSREPGDPGVGDQGAADGGPAGPSRQDGRATSRELADGSVWP